MSPQLKLKDVVHTGDPNQGTVRYLCLFHLLPGPCNRHHALCPYTVCRLFGTRHFGSCSSGDLFQTLSTTACNTQIIMF